MLEERKKSGSESADDTAAAAAAVSEEGGADDQSKSPEKEEIGILYYCYTIYKQLSHSLPFLVAIQMKPRCWNS